MAHALHQCQDGQVGKFSCSKPFPLKVVTYKNAALDHFLEECLEIIPSPALKLIRVPGPKGDASQTLQECSVWKVNTAYL